ncbi:MAG: hypothetical protein IPJ82_12165 [Lewinellaceae bacterium]|nr:hypothetical protein [Lewinellaceae bacterium]
MRLLYSIVILFVTLSNLSAQTDSSGFPPLKIGEWRQHLPWQRSTYVTQSDTKVYFSSEWAVVEIDKADRSQRFLTKVEGLSDVGIRLIRYNREAGALIVAYTNSNLDIYYPADGAVVNLPFIKKNINIVGDKQVNDVAFEGKFAYLASAFGVLKLNLERKEVEYTVFTDVVVKSFAVYNGNLYAGTEEGLFRIASDDVNPEDFSRWQMLGAADGFPAGVSVNALNVWNNQLYLGIGKTLYSYDGSGVSTIATNPTRDVFYLSSEGPGLMIGWKQNIGTVEYMEPSGARYEIQGPCGAEVPLYGIEDGSKKFWIADGNDQYRYYDHNTGVCERFSYNSPYFEHSTEIAVANDKVYVATPGALSDLSPLYRDFGIYIFENGQWGRFYGGSNPELADEDGYAALWRVAPHPSEDKFYAGSFVGGVVEATAPGAPTVRYTQNNSILQGAGSAGSNRTAIGGLAFDSDNNLWICNYGAGSPIAVLKADGTLRNFSAAPANNLLQVVVDQSGYKWFVIGFNGGVLVYDSGDDLDNPADDRYRIINSGNSALPTNSVTTIAVDLEGDVWVGTQQGAVSFECGSNVFDASSCTGRRRIVNVEGFNAYLLETEEVRAIAVDGANRKWFGTTNGVFVQSPDALTQEARFTSTNSPLFDDAITDIAINQKSGEVWIGTEKGLISLRAEATEGGRINSLMPYAYPNPVRPDYDGPIAIYGLARDANVKITDVGGNLVYEGKALGGQAVWNGRDYLGRRVASGVYMIFATSSASFESPDAIITKVVILN